MGIGPGGLPPDFELLGVMDEDRGAMMVESIDTILGIWSSDPPHKIAGKYWNVEIKDWVVPEIGLGQMAKPFQKPHPPIAVSAMSPYSGMMRLAAVRDWDAVSANFIGNWSVKSHWDAHIDECEKQGKRPDAERWRVARSVFVADTDAEAEEFANRPGGAFDYYYDYLFTIFDRADMKAAFVTEKDMDPATLTHQKLRQDLVIWGSPETVTRKLLAFRDQVGHFGTLLMTAHDWTEPEILKRSMTLMAEEVMPAVNQEIGDRVAAQ